jgi:4-hydroxy-4-methyl-2-oxoglutarate aldolase
MKEPLVNTDGPIDYAALPQLASATVYEASGQRGSLPPEIKPLAPGRHVQGQAFTVSCAPRDNLALHHAIAVAPAGSMIVCHTSGWYDAGYFGDVLAAAAAARGVVGLVIDACVRDFADIAHGPVRVFARGLSVRGTTKDPALPSAVNTRLRIGPVDIDPGDFVVGDDDGVVVIAASRLSLDVQSSMERQTAETAFRRRLADGETTTSIYRLPDLR